MQATDLRKGSRILFNGELQIVTDYRHGTPGNKRGFVQATLKSLTSGKQTQHKFSSTDSVERAVLDPRQCQYLYHDQEGYHFMDMNTYDNFALREENIGDAKYYLIEEMELKIDFFDGNPLVPELPKIVELVLTDCPPGVKGDSVSNNTKPAVTQTGLKLQVPMFINEGDKIKVNTETGDYGGRA